MTDRTIDVDALWRVAARRTRASAVPPRDLEVEGLRCLVSSLQVPGRYDATPCACSSARSSCGSRATLAFQRDLAEHPGIREVPVARPLFIVGFGRTGSTLLQNLLALDPEARTPRLWEVLAPSPPPRREDFSADPRIAAAQRRLEVFVRVDPRVQQIHPMAAEAPDECHWMMRHSPLAVTL
jgi:hypothetical protein